MFAILVIPDYTLDQFTEIAITKLTRENVDESAARVIAEKVWNELDSKDVRDVLKIGRLTTNIQEIPFIVRMLKRRTQQRNN